MVTINETACIGCGLCAADCVANNITLEHSKAQVKGPCFQCGHCVAICPSNAVALPEYEMGDVEEYDEETFSIQPENLLHSIKFRRSIRSYQHRPVAKEHLEMLAQAGRYTATAKNNQDCCFVFVQTELEELKSRTWAFIEAMEQKGRGDIPREQLAYLAFNRQRKANPGDDFLFRNAPAVLFITSDWPLDAGLAAQNVENMAVSLGMGVLYNGYLSRITDVNEELKRWLGIEGKSIKACQLIGYPARQYARTAPRRSGQVIWK